MRRSIICSWPWWTDPLTPPLPMKLMKNLLQRALVDKVTRIRSPWTLADRKGSGRGQWTRSFSLIKIWLVHFQVFSIRFQNNFRYLVSHILRFWGILVSWGQNSGYIGIPLPPLAGPDSSKRVMSQSASERSILRKWIDSVLAASYRTGSARSLGVNCLSLYELVCLVH